jgi:hypothetical protein
MVKKDFTKEEVKPEREKLRKIQNIIYSTFGGSIKDEDALKQIKAIVMSEKS